MDHTARRERRATTFERWVARPALLGIAAGGLAFAMLVFATSFIGPTAAANAARLFSVALGLLFASAMRIIWRKGGMVCSSCGAFVRSRHEVCPKCEARFT